MKKLKHKPITIDDAIFKLLEAKMKYGNIPLTLEIDKSLPFDIKEQEYWYVKDILINKESATLYNY